jgi:hypothetical protein
VCNGHSIKDTSLKKRANLRIKGTSVQKATIFTPASPIAKLSLQESPFSFMHFGYAIVVLEKGAYLKIVIGYLTGVRHLAQSLGNREYVLQLDALRLSDVIPAISHAALVP